MNLCQVALRRDSIPGTQVPGLDSLPEAALNSLVRRQPVTSTLTFSRHSRSRNLESAYNESPLSGSLEIVKKKTETPLNLFLSLDFRIPIFGPSAHFHQQRWSRSVCRGQSCRALAWPFLTALQ